MKKLQKKWLLMGIALLVLTGAGASYLRAHQKPKLPQLKYRFERADMGTITQSVTATGTINPVALVNVGSQISGTVVELHADFNDHVKKGQALLKLDPTIFSAQVAQSRANVESAEASLRLAQSTFGRNQRLLQQGFVSNLGLEQSRRELDVAGANVKLAKAQLARAQADLDNSVIRSPINGVIIKRTIDLGQTVAASFNTPNLFQIAQDLTKMQINTNVSEADIGALKDGQTARFVVDAYPDKEFEARMRQFRLAANVVQNVVTYDVVLDVDNKDMLLKPGMTAQVRLLVGNRENVLRIPTAALRFHPSEDEVEAAQGKNKNAPAVSDVAFRSDDEQARVFKIYRIDERNQLRPVEVKIGLSNFRYTELVGGGIKPNDRVALRAIAPKSESTF